MILVWGTSGRRFKSCRSHYTLVTQIVPSPNTDMIELENISENIYDNFLESMRSSETKRMYVRNLKKFLNLIPNNIFEEYLGESPKSREIEDLSTSFTNLAKKDINATKQIIKSYVKEINKEVTEGRISPNTVKNKIKPIKALFLLMRLMSLGL